MNDIGIALLTYSRPSHAQQVAEGLRRQGIDRFTVYMDGADDADIRRKQAEMATYFETIDWADVRLVRRDQNLGLAKSVVSAVSDQLERHGAMILLEDDCVPQPGFFEFFREGFAKYQDDASVRSLCGYQFPFASDADATLGARVGERFVPWGWGTWRERWQDYDVYLEQVVERISRSAAYDRLPADLRAYCNDENLRKGRGDIWSLNWVLAHYATGTRVVFPSRTLIHNVGFDGSGVHCVETDVFDHAGQQPPVTAGPTVIRLPARAAADPGYDADVRSYMEQHSRKTMFSSRSETLVSAASLGDIVDLTVESAPVFDLHTHLFPPQHAGFALSGADELLAYHYLIAEALAVSGLQPELFHGWPRRRQAAFIWDELFVKRTPMSEATRGVLTTLRALKIETGPLPWSEIVQAVEAVADRNAAVFTASRVQAVVMTNDPFNVDEWALFDRRDWDRDRWLAALRLDALYDDRPRAMQLILDQGFKRADGSPDVAGFIDARLRQSGARYAAISLDGAAVRTVFADPVTVEQVLPVLRAHGLSFALMVGVTRAVNPRLRMAGDGLGSFDGPALAEVFARFTDNRFMMTTLGETSQHEAAVLARKFANLRLFGFWWFMNQPSLIAPALAMRFDMLGTNFVPQHSDARVLEQLVYKWSHFKTVLKGVLRPRYAELLALGWPVTAAMIRRDVHAMLHDDAARLLAPDRHLEAA